MSEGNVTQIISRSTGGWIQLTEIVEGNPVWVNAQRSFGIIQLKDNQGRQFTRIFSGDQAGVALPDPRIGQLVPHVLPCALDVKETPEQIFIAAYGRLPEKVS